MYVSVSNYGRGEVELRLLSSDLKHYSLTPSDGVFEWYGTLVIMWNQTHSRDKTIATEPNELRIIDWWRTYQSLRLFQLQPD
jgi:hypothetical protein